MFVKLEKEILIFCDVIFLKIDNNNISLLSLSRLLFLGGKFRVNKKFCMSILRWKCQELPTLSDQLITDLYMRSVILTQFPLGAVEN